MDLLAPIVQNVIINNTIIKKMKADVLNVHLDNLVMILMNHVRHAQIFVKYVRMIQIVLNVI